MKLSIMYTLQPSVNDGEKWMLLGDSNTNMMRGFMEELFKQVNCELTFNILVPYAENCSDYDMLLEGLDLPLDNVILWHTSPEAPVDANRYRYFFNDKNTATIDEWFLQDADNFVFWNNIPEQTANYMSYLRHPKAEVETPENLFIVNCCYFLDSPLHAKTAPESRDYKKMSANWWRQVEGALRADIAGFCCDGNLNQFMEGASYTHTDHIVQQLTKKAHVFRFGYSPTELSAAVEVGWDRLDNNMYAAGKELIVFPNRITTPDYTNFELFAEAMRILSNLRDDFVWTATNPGQKYIKNADMVNNKDYPNYFFTSDYNLDRVQYASLLAHATIHCSLFVEEANGGCACREAMHCKSLPVMPFANEYTRLATAHYPGYINVKDGKVTAEDIAIACDRLLTRVKDNEMKWQDFAEDYEFNHEMGSFVNSTAVVIDALSDVCNIDCLQD